MGLKASTSGTVRAVTVAGFSLTLTPSIVEIPYGSVDMVAEFTVGIVREPGHTKNVYLDLIGMAGNWSFSQDFFGYSVNNQVVLSVDLAGFPRGHAADFQIDGYDDINDRPVA